MKIQAGSFLNSAKKIADIVNSRTRKINNKDKANKKSIVVNIRTKINKIQKNKYILQSEISKRQSIKEGLSNITELINEYKNKSISLKDIKKEIAYIIHKQKYDKEKLLNNFLIENTKQDKINNKEDLQEYRKEILNLNNNIETEIDEITQNINELLISENNLLSLNILNENQTNIFIEELKNDSANIKNIHIPINIEEIDKLLSE